MMTISDIIEIIVVCALIFFPLGYLARHSLRRIRDTLRFVLLLNLVMLNRPGRYAARKKPGQPKNDSIYAKCRHAFFPLAILARPFRLELLFLVKFGLLWAGYLNFHRSSIWCLPRFY